MISVQSLRNSRKIGISAFDELSDVEPVVIALGMFDGVHLAHKAILQKTVELSAKYGASPTMFTFCNHPLEIVDPQRIPTLLTTTAEKAHIAADIGIRQMVLMWFDEQFAQLSPEEFAEKYIFNLNCKAVVCGYDYRFGKGGKGDVETLKKLLDKFNIQLEVIDRMDVDGVTVSSSYIRNLVEKADFETAKRYLGYGYFVGGQVSHGFERGRELGFPTANILPDKHKTLPDDGVYATKTLIKEKEFISVTNIGTNPTFGNYRKTVETYIDGFDGDIYGEYIAVEFIAKIRNEMKFASLDELKNALANDLAKAKEIVE